MKSVLIGAKEIEDPKRCIERVGTRYTIDEEICSIKRDFGKYIPSLMVEIRDEKLNDLIDE